MRMKRLFFATLLAVLATGCGDGADRALTRPDGAKPKLTTVATVSVCCSTTLSAGGTANVFADVYDTNGQWVANPFVTWWSSNNSVVSVYGTGRTASIAANGVGNAVIYASVNGVTGATTIQVRAVPVVTTVEVSPSSVGLNVGQTQPLSARAYDQYGNQMSGQTATWSTGNSAVATVSSSGMVTGVAAGSTTVTATIAGKTGSVPVTVQNLSVSISGPTTIFSAGGYDWVATATGGSGNYTYRWWIDWGGSQVYSYGTGDTASLYVSEHDSPFFALTVEVTSGGQTATASIGVCNFISTAMC